MTGKVTRQRFSKNQWLEAGLQMLSNQGVDKLSIGSLSRTVGVAKTSFYWHFKDRQDLLDHMLEYWVSEFNAVLTDNPDLPQLPPKQRLQAIADTVVGQDLAKYELAIRGWASHDEAAMAVFDNIHSRRMAVIQRAFADADFDEQEQKTRAELFNCYLNWGKVMNNDPLSFKTTVNRLIPMLLQAPVEAD
ncbi:TetR/AcrR family transcriptional regulator [Shewanella atlantica]|uniref:TetR/AcrR family transcriptional regulator n=1 Tax=Shewanella atlantica TaxID=271099 RepID=A0A431W8E6_9GAMM|nr:TetR/AcrR family transcriptional regulator [Shewanella atlantica]RTR31782.1 TetR/AcrR family transcriptional regulator [Shewanella atlantica]